MLDDLQKKSVWEINEGDFPRAGNIREKLVFLLNYAILAPSSHNTQPWKFKFAGDSVIELYADESRWLKVADADKRELYLSVGCALENLLVAAEHFDFEMTVDYFPQAGNEALVAAVKFVPGQPLPESRRKQLFKSVTRRSTFHGSFAAAPVSESILREIMAYGEDKGINLYFTTDEQIRLQVNDLIARSDALLFANAAYREELAYWIGQGAFGTGWLMSQLGRLAMNYLNLGNFVARNDAGVLQSAPVMGLLTSLFDDRRLQVRAGQAFERVYLAAQSHGIGIRPMSQILQIPDHRTELQKLIPLPHNHPQQPFLLGYAEQSDKHTPRRPLKEVLI